MSDSKEPCGNKDCDACYPLPRWTVRRVTVRRIAHEREITPATRVAGVDRESRSAWTSELGHRYRVTKVVPMRIDRRQLRLA